MTNQHNLKHEHISRCPTSIREYGSSLVDLAYRGAGMLIAGGGVEIFHKAGMFSLKSFDSANALINDGNYVAGIIPYICETGLAGAFALAGYSFIKIGYHLTSRGKRAFNEETPKEDSS